jgi:hypothetical protein
MASVTIRILDQEATIEHYKLTAPDKLKGLLDTYLDVHRLSPSDPFPEMTVAQEVVSRIGGEIISFEPPVYPDDGKERIY